MSPFIQKLLKKVFIIIFASHMGPSLAMPQSDPSPAPTIISCGKYYSNPPNGKGKKGPQTLAETHRPSSPLKGPTISPVHQGTLSSDGSIPSYSPSNQERSPSPSIIMTKSSAWPTQTNKNTVSSSSSRPSLRPSTRVPTKTTTTTPPPVPFQSSIEPFPSITPSTSFLKKQGGSEVPSQSPSEKPTHYDTVYYPSASHSMVPTMAKEGTSSPPPSSNLPSFSSTSTFMSHLQSIGCYDSSRDIFGSISSHQSIIQFSYEIVYDPIYEFTDMLRSLESSISLSILRTWPVPGCNHDIPTYTTSHMNMTHGTQRMTGFSSRPPDKVSAGKTCRIFSNTTTTTNSSSSNTCNSIDGRFSIFFKDQTQNDDFASQLLAFIQQGMENDVYIGSHVGILKVIFVEENLKRDTPAQERGTEGPSKPVDNSMLPVFAWYLVASAGVLIVGVALRKWFVKRRESNYGELGNDSKSDEEPEN